MEDHHNQEGPYIMLKKHFIYKATQYKGETS